MKDERIKVGTKIWLRPFGNAARFGGSIKEREITSIGKKYFYCGELKVDIATMRENGFNSWHEAYFSEQEIKDVIEAELLKQRIESFFTRFNSPNLPLETLRTIHGLINTTA